MTVQAYGLSPGRVNEILGETLAYAEPTMVLALGCEMKQIPKNKGDNVSYRRIIPTGGATTNANTINRWSVTSAAHLLQEGVTPDAETLTDQYVNVQINQYGAIYGWTNKTADLHEDDIPKDMSRIMGKRMGLVQEMIRYGVMKACTNVYYAGGTTRATTDEAISLAILRRAARGPPRRRLDGAAAPVDAHPVDLPHGGHLHGRLVELRRAGLGRLLGLGSG